MTAFHRILGFAIVLLFVGVMLWALALRVSGRKEAPKSFWVTQHWIENVLILQTVAGVVLLVLGRRTTGSEAFLHYFYGSLFPFVAVVGGRIAGLRRESHEYVGVGWGSFFAFGLTLRAMQTGCAGILTISCIFG